MLRSPPGFVVVGRYDDDVVVAVIVANRFGCRWFEDNMGGVRRKLLILVEEHYGRASRTGGGCLMGLMGLGRHREGVEELRGGQGVERR
jgi:hypothetical protein